MADPVFSGGRHSIQDLAILWPFSYEKTHKNVNSGAEHEGGMSLVTPKFLKLAYIIDFSLLLNSNLLAVSFLPCLFSVRDVTRFTYGRRCPDKW